MAERMRSSCFLWGWTWRFCGIESENDVNNGLQCMNIAPARRVGAFPRCRRAIAPGMGACM